MPKALAIDDDDVNRRRGRSKRAPVEVDVDVERNLVMRVLLHSPKDTLAGCVALAGVIAIIINAMFLQAGRHPAPMFNTAFPVDASAPVTAPPVIMPATAAPVVAPVNPLPRPRPPEAEAKPADKPSETVTPATRIPLPPVSGSAVTRPPASVPTSTHNDPLGNLIISTRRIMAVQRLLTEYGYGQLKPTGTTDADTQAAIQKFEREHKFPVTGQISDRLIRQLDAMTGRTIN